MSALGPRAGSSRRRPPLWVVIVTVVAVALLAVAAGAITTLVGQSRPAPEAGATASASPLATAEPSTTETPVPVPPATTAPPSTGSLPAACTDVFNAEYIAMMEGDDLPLNNAALIESVGTLDEQLRAVISSNPTLLCTWGSEGDNSVTTNVTEVDETEGSNVESRLRTLGYNCYSESSGLRCTRESTGVINGENVASGESHFLRDDLWLATYWVNATPARYTPSMVQQIWG